MKPRLQATLGQQLVMTPQLQQAIRLLQLSTAELEAELTEAVETNPLLDWVEPGQAVTVDGLAVDRRTGHDGQGDPGANGADPAPPDGEWRLEDGDAWQPRLGPADVSDDDFSPEQAAPDDDLHDHLLWQLHLSHLSPRDRAIGAALVEAIDDDGYLREPVDAVARMLADEGVAEPEVVAVLRCIQSFDPPGVGARDLGECLRLQLAVLPADTPHLELAARIASGPLEQLPKSGVGGLAASLRLPAAEVEAAVALLRSLEPRPGAALSALPTDTYVVPDVVVWRQGGTWRIALSSDARPRVAIHRGYEAMAGSASEADATYLKGRLQEARWLLRSLEARAHTLVRVVRCLVRQQSAFLEFGEQALRPLTLREVAAEVGLHESTISRAVARKFVRTPRGTIPLRAFFASGVGHSGEESSSTAIQAMIRRLVEHEDPRKPLSDARLADALKAAGVPVARRTVAKYREAIGLPSSQDRLRI
ncbi:RNA polymerase factor sigma-54 [Luteimonas pelagia]